jgi:TRAP-type C4-dicarboxylate transport system substrate-binding protein
MVFRSFAEVDHVRGQMDALVLAGLERGGIVSFGIAEGGFAYIMSREPVRTLDDLVRQRVWVPDNDPTTLKAAKGFRITPIPLSLADVRASLQTGLINTVASPPIGAVALQWHTQVRYLLELPLFYIYGTLGVNARDFRKLSPTDQAVTRDVMGRVFRAIDRQNRQDNVSAMETLRKQGIAFTRPSAEELAQWHAKGAVAMREVIDAGNISPEFMAIFQQQLDAARSQNPNP